MSSAIRTLDDRNLTIGWAVLGRRGDRTGSVNQQVHDGDTIIVRADGNIGVRFLGIDTAEVSFRLPGQRNFRRLSDPLWESFLSDPFDEQWPEFDPPLDEGLRRWFENRVGPGTAENQQRHAQAATDALRDEVRKDMQTLEQGPEGFRFFLAFAFEIMDGYGRFLCYVNREQPDAEVPERRPLTYNERLLQMGMTHPYFIWPNINPWRRAASIMDAVLQPGTARTTADDDQTLRRARDWMRRNRRNHVGIYDAMDPLRLEPFELRMLAGRRPPRRWVIDLSRNDATLIRPQNYYTIPHAEDRLFIPEEYVPLFVEKGWRREA